MSCDIRMNKTDHGQWPEKRSTIQQLCEQRQNLSGCAMVCLPFDYHLSAQDQQSLSRAFGIPSCTWEPQYQKATGFFLADEVKDNSGALQSYVTSFRFLIKSLTVDTGNYAWTEIGVWTQWKPSHSSILLCTIAGPGKSELWNSICRAFREAPTIGTNRPLDWHIFLLPHVSRQFDDSVWSCRDFIRNMEKSRPEITSVRPRYASMFEMARHANHITEVLAMSIEVIENLIQEVKRLQHAARQCPSIEIDPAAVDRVLSCQKTLLQCSHGRSQALTVRLQNEINLAFHIGTERDSAIGAQMARSMQQDSTAMKTISFLGLVFLPGTFVSAIFSMSFFNGSPNTSGKAVAWEVSSQFWIYWAITVPITLTTLGLWYAWQRHMLKAHPMGDSLYVHR